MADGFAKTAAESGQLCNRQAVYEGGELRSYNPGDGGKTVSGHEGLGLRPCQA